MPYLLLIIGIVIAVFALYRFLIKANASQIKALVLSILLIAIGLGAFVLAVTGRLPAALALMGACVPFGIKYLKNRARRREDVSTVIEVEAEEIKDEDDEGQN